MKGIVKILFCLSPIILALVPFISFANGGKSQSIEFADFKLRAEPNNVLLIDARPTAAYYISTGVYKWNSTGTSLDDLCGQYYIAGASGADKNCKGKDDDNE